MSFIQARNRRTLVIVGAAIMGVGTGGCASRPVETVSGGEVVLATRPVLRVREAIAAWPMTQREIVDMLTTRYGEPSVVGDRMVAWFNSGPFVKTVVMRDAQAHNFPMPHVDYLTQTVKHRVPADRLDDLHDYDGSVWYHRTRGELSAQCDVEAMNFLALNLSHDVITGKRTVSDARAFYAKTAMEFKNGNRSGPYVTGLMFATEPGSADPDRAHQM